MQLSDLFNYLRAGELSQLISGTDESRDNQIITNINLGLIELYKRFPIKLSEVIIQLSNRITHYTISSSHAESSRPIGNTSPEFYVIDSPYYPFKDDLNQIEVVYNEEGEELPLNDENLTYSLFTVGHNVLLHPYPENENTISIIYRASAPLLLIDGDLTQTVEIPNHLVELLTSYVAYKTFSAINMSSPEATGYFSKFETSCNLITNLGLISKSSNTNLRLEINGWV